jgi:hypothetical protein
MENCQTPESRRPRGAGRQLVNAQGREAVNDHVSRGQPETELQKSIQQFPSTVAVAQDVCSHTPISSGAARVRTTRYRP